MPHLGAAVDNPVAVAEEGAGCRRRNGLRKQHPLGGADAPAPLEDERMGAADRIGWMHSYRKMSSQPAALPTPVHNRRIHSVAQSRVDVGIVFKVHPLVRLLCCNVGSECRVVAGAVP